MLDAVPLLIVLVVAAALMSAVIRGAAIIWGKADSAILKIIIIVLWLTAFPAMLGISVLVGLFGRRSFA